MRAIAFFIYFIVLAMAIQSMDNMITGKVYYTNEYYPEITIFPVSDGAVYYNSKGNTFTTGCVNRLAGRLAIYPDRPTPISTTGFE